MRSTHLLDRVDSASLTLAAASAAPPEMPRFRWENFTTANGLPDNHVYCVLVDGDRDLGRHRKRARTL